MPLGREVGFSPSDLSPSDIVLKWDPAHPPPQKKKRGGGNFRPMSIVAKQLDGSKKEVRGGVELWLMARWKAHVEFLLSVIVLG